MDALDVKILRNLGTKPFSRWPREVPGLKPSAIARRLGKNVQLINDRIARMEQRGVIRGYRLFPNLKHCGQNLTTFHMVGKDLPAQERLAHLRAVDGVVGVLWFLGPDVCIDIAHATAAERDRRVGLLARLADGDLGPLPFYERQFPDVDRQLSALDWRIIRALEGNARRPLSEVAEEVGVTAKTVRTRLNRMRSDGSVDEYVDIAFDKVSGMVPFMLSAWFEDGLAPVNEILAQFRERHIGYFQPPPGGFSEMVLMAAAPSPAGVQSMVRETTNINGVDRAQPYMPTGGYWNDQWYAELLDQQTSQTT